MGSEIAEQIRYMRCHGWEYEKQTCSLIVRNFHSLITSWKRWIPQSHVESQIETEGIHHFGRRISGSNMDGIPLGFHRVELNKTEWTVPDRYRDLNAIGGGAFGQVW